MFTSTHLVFSTFIIIYLWTSDCILIANPLLSTSTCTKLKNCKPFMTLMKKSQKTSQQRQSALKFLKSQICAFADDEPLVHCGRVPDFISDPSLKMQLNESLQCKSSFECVTLLECAPLLYLFGLEKPISPGILKFIKSQQCGSGKTYPKVCCKQSVNYTQRHLYTSSEPTTSNSKITTIMSLLEKSDAMNRYFNGGFSDFMAFDFFIRKKRQQKWT